MKLKDIMRILEENFPIKNSEEWDNIGLLVGNAENEIKKVQFSIDVTLNAIDNAINNSVDLIIAHHPIIFKAIKNIKEDNVLGKKLIKLIKNNISVYCLHTNLDSTLGGLNDYILEKLEIKESKILDFEENNNFGIGRIYTLDKKINLEDYIEKLKEKLEIKNLRLISNDLNKEIKKIALINGSAMSYWRKAKLKNVDLFITGDITYHDALDALENNLSVIDFGHFESEHFFFEILEKKLKNLNLEFSIYNDGPIFKFM